MARARNIKPGFFQNEDLAELEPIARLAFIGMWTIADNDGVITLVPDCLKKQILPFDEIHIHVVLDRLESHGFIIFDRDSGNIQILDFRSWCNVSDRSLSSLHSANRRAVKRMSKPKWADIAAIKEIYQSAEHIRADGNDVHVDHIYPLNGRTVCGLHVHTNLRIISASENLKKSNKLPEALWQE